MAATWKITTIESDPEDFIEFKELLNQKTIRGKYNAVLIANDLGLTVQEYTRKVQAGASPIIQSNLREAVRNNPRIFFASMSGPRGTYYDFVK